MKLLLLIFFVVFCAIGLSVFVNNDPGYTTISFHHWVISANLWTAGACTLLAFILFYAVMRSIHHIIHFPKYLSRRRELAQAHRYRIYMEKGVMGLASGDFKQAEKYFLRVNEQKE